MCSLLPKIKNYDTAKPLCFFLFCFRKGKTKNFSKQFRAVFFLLSIYLKQGTRNPYSLLLWTVVGGRVGYKAWQEFCCVCLELVCHKCLGVSGIWTSFDGELCPLLTPSLCTVGLLAMTPKPKKKLYCNKL